MTDSGVVAPAPWGACWLRWTAAWLAAAAAGVLALCAGAAAATYAAPAGADAHALLAAALALAAALISAALVRTRARPAASLGAFFLIMCLCHLCPVPSAFLSHLSFSLNTAALAIALHAVVVFLSLFCPGPPDADPSSTGSASSADSPDTDASSLIYALWAAVKAAALLWLFVPAYPVLVATFNMSRSLDAVRRSAWEHVCDSSLYTLASLSLIIIAALPFPFTEPASAALTRPCLAFLRPLNSRPSCLFSPFPSSLQAH